MWFICLRCYKIYIFEDKITYIIMIYNSFNVLFFTNKQNHCSTHSLKPFDILRFITAGFFINVWFIYIYIYIYDGGWAVIWKYPWQVFLLYTFIYIFCIYRHRFVFERLQHLQSEVNKLHWDETLVCCDPNN